MQTISSIVDGNPRPEWMMDAPPEKCSVCGESIIKQGQIGRHKYSYAARHDHDPILIAEKEKIAAQKQIELEAYRLNNRQRLVGKIYAGGFDSFDRAKQPEAFVTVAEYAADPKGWLFLTGEVGTGKTHLMAGAVIEIVRAKSCDAKMINVSELMAECRNAIDADRNHDPIDDYKKLGLLALDDLGTQKRTEWADENLYRLFDYRLVNELPMIVTSNFTLKEIATWEGWERIADRIIQAAKIVRLRAGSYRREAAIARLGKRP